MTQPFAPPLPATIMSIPSIMSIASISTDLSTPTHIPALPLSQDGRRQEPDCLLLNSFQFPARQSASTTRSWVISSFLFHFLCLSFLLALPFSSQAFVEPWLQWAKRPVDVPLILKTTVKAQGTVTLNLGENSYPITGAGCSDDVVATFIPQLKPYETYSFSLSGSQVQEIKIEFDPYTPRYSKPGVGIRATAKPYLVLVGGIDTNRLEFTGVGCSIFSTNCLIELRPDRGPIPAALMNYETQWSREEDSNPSLAPGDGFWPEIGPGRDTAPASGAIRWGVSLGRLWNGQSCGLLRLNEKAINAGLFTAAPLTYTARSTNESELKIITTSPSGDLRQIKAPQALVDIQSFSSPTQQCLIRFFLLSQISSFTNGLYQTGSSTPFVTWKIANYNGSGVYTGAVFIEERLGRTNASLVSYSSGATTWTVVTGAGDAQRTDRRIISITGSNRTETVEILQGSNLHYKAVESYFKFPWGWELTNVVSNPGSYGLTNSFTFYDSTNYVHAYRKMKDHWYPGGKWERHFYVREGLCPVWPSGATYFSLIDNAEVIMKPWLDLAPSPDLVTNLSTVSYTINVRERHDSPEHLNNWYSDEYKGEYNDYGFITYSLGCDAVSCLNIALDYENYALGAGEERLHWKYDRPGHYTHDLTHITADKTGRNYYEYFKGVFNPVTFQFTVNESSGPDFLSIQTQGSHQFSDADGLYVTNCFYNEIQTGNLMSPKVHAHKSTQTKECYQGGNLVYTELLAMALVNEYNQPVFTPYARYRLQYDSLGHLTNKTWIDAVNSSVQRPVFQASYRSPSGLDWDLKSWEINEAGEKTLFYYDSLKRLTNSVHLGVAAQGNYATQLDRSTQTTYDIVGRIKGERQSGGTLSLSRFMTYDLAGRLTSSSGLDGIVTNISYSTDARTTTETYPGGLTKVTTLYPDGRLRSITGTAVVSEYYTNYVLEGVAMGRMSESMVLAARDSIKNSSKKDWRTKGKHKAKEDKKKEQETDQGGGDMSLMGLESLNLPKSVSRISYGSVSSARWKEMVYNAGRQLVEERSPRFRASSEPLTIAYETFSGLVYHRQTPAIPGGEGVFNLEEEYFHNGYGGVVKTNFDILLSAARAQGQDAIFEFIGGCVYELSFQHSNTATNFVRRRLSGFTSASLIDESMAIDPYEVGTYQIQTVDLAQKRVTTVASSPRSTIPITRVVINGLLQSENSESVALPTWFYYDDLGRQIAQRAPLDLKSGICYDTVTGWTAAVTNQSGNVTQYDYYPTNGAHAGQVRILTGPTGKKTYYDYTSRGELWRTWGDVPYPEEREYNSLGEMTHLRTYQVGQDWSASAWPGGGLTPQTTLWAYDLPTGLLTNKTDALSRSVRHDYHWTGFLKTTTNARNIVTTFALDELGDILSRTYSDGTLSTSSAMGIWGKPDWTANSFFTCYYSYDHAGALTNTTWIPSGDFPSATFSQIVDPVYGRGTNYLQGLYDSESNPVPLEQRYQHDPNSGRLASVHSGNHRVTYAYLANSDLLEYSRFYGTNTEPRLATRRYWEHGYRLRGVSNTPALSQATAITYTYDDLDRRRTATLAGGSVWTYTYNDRNELLSGKRAWADSTPVAGQQFEYLYDPIGNRTTTRFGGDVLGANLRSSTASFNALNQFSQLTTPGYRSILGSATAGLEVTVAVNSACATALRQGSYYCREAAFDNSSGPLCLTISVAADRLSYQGSLLAPSANTTPAYDLDGNLTHDGLWHYRYDAENRLVEMHLTNIVGLANYQRKRLQFSYDEEGRRLRKAVSTWTGSGFGAPVTTYYLYDQENLLAEAGFDDYWGCYVLRQSYLWGQDLSGGLAGEEGNAGGIGGLVALQNHDSGTVYFPTYDGNGNVTGLIESTTQGESARYDYSPYGELLCLLGPAAPLNPFRWSTKYWDDESDLVYYGKRYYKPDWAKWISADPAGITGGKNLYSFVANDPINQFDPLGMTSGTAADNQAAMAEGAEIQAGGQAASRIGFKEIIREAADNWNESQEFLVAAMQGDPEGMLEAGLEIAKNVFASKLKITKRSVGTERHHATPKVYGGDPDQDLTKLPGNMHSALHSALYQYMKTFGMNYKRGQSGRKILEKYTPEKVMEKLAAFYKTMAKQHPDLARAAEDFFNQNPHLK